MERWSIPASLLLKKYASRLKINSPASSLMTLFSKHTSNTFCLPSFFSLSAESLALFFPHFWSDDNGAQNFIRKHAADANWIFIPLWLDTLLCSWSITLRWRSREVHVSYTSCSGQSGHRLMESQRPRFSGVSLVFTQFSLQWFDERSQDWLCVTVHVCVCK